MVLILVAVLLGAAFGCLSIGLALLVRREETLIATVQFLLLPLSFMSVTFMQKSLMPDWMQTVSDFNPRELGGRSGPRRGHRRAPTGARSPARPASWSPSCCLCGALRDAGVPHLPAGGLSGRGRPGDLNSPRQCWAPSRRTPRSVTAQIFSPAAV